MGRLTRACAVLGLLLLWSAGRGQANDVSEYRFYPGDVFNLHVFGRADLAMAYTVRPDGKVMLPLVGEVVVAGRTSQEVADRIAKGMGRVIAKPQVSVSLVTMGPRRAYVLGPVATQGVMPLQPRWRLTELIARAGGLLVRPDMAKAYLLRQGETRPREINLQRLLLTLSPEENLEVGPGDVLDIVRLDTISVFVVGAVGYPGSREVTEGLGVAQVIKIAGQAMPLADLAHVLLVHVDGDQEWIDISGAYIDNDPSRDVALRAGDLVWVPKRGDRAAPQSVPAD